MPADPSRLTGIVRKQAGLARSLWWAVRRRADVGPGDVALPYNGPDRVLLYAISVLGVLEIAVAHVLVSWPPLRWTLFVLGVYGLLAFIAFDFTMRQHPHVIRGGELVLRFGHFRSARVPLDGLVSVRKHVQNAHAKNVELDGDALSVSFMGGTNVELRFSPAVEARVDGVCAAATRVSFSADDPAAAVALLRTRVASTER
jgi:hypothetical protein